MENQEIEHLDDFIQEGDADMEMPETMDWKQASKDIECPAMILCGVRRSGKSHATREILYQMCTQMKPDLVVLFSYSAELSDDFDYVPDFYKYNSFDEDRIQKFLDQQTESTKRYRAMKKKNKSYDKKPAHILFIFDDIAHDKHVFHSKALGELFIMGRHKFCSVVLLSQHLSALPPRVRNNSDIICSFRDANWYNRQCLRDQFMTLSSTSRKEVQKFMDKTLGEPHRMCVVCIYKIQQANKLSDFIFTYLAPKKTPKFKLAQKQFWSKETALKPKHHKKNVLQLEEEYLKPFRK